MGTYVTETGLKRKTLQEIRSELEAGFKEVFGPDFETAVDSPNGLLISQLASSLSNVWELAYEVYISRDPNQATGVSLDFAAFLNGLFRKTSTACKVKAMLFSLSERATIPAGSKAMRTRGNLLFSLDEEVTIDRTACNKLLIKDNESELNKNYLFQFTFGDVTLNNTQSSVANLNALATAILAAGGLCDFLTNDANDGLLVWAPDGGSVGITGTLPEDFEIYAMEPGNFTADETGVQTCEVGELNDIPRSVQGWDKVYNGETGVPGTDTENDNQLRVRRERSAQAIKSTATDSSIAAHLMAEVEGVTAAIVTSNRTMTEDADSRPAKSFEVFVDGGNDQDVAQNIYENMPSGIQCYGNISIPVIDEQGDQQIISFSRPQAKYLWVKITYHLYDEEQFPGVDRLKASILKWAEREYDTGKDVIPDRIYSALYPPYVKGVGQASVEVAVTDNVSQTPSYGTSTISILKSQYAVLAADRVTLIKAKLKEGGGSGY